MLFSDKSPGAYGWGAGTARPPVADSQKGTFPIGSIFFVCQKGDLAGLEALVKDAAHYRIPVATCTEKDEVMGVTPLHVAAEAGQAHIVEYLIKTGVEVDCGDKFLVTPLHLGALGGFTEICGALLVAQATITAQDVAGDLPIHWAATKGHADVIRLFLRKGSPMDAKNYEDWTPLHRAAFTGQPAAVEVLLQAGASPSARNRDQNCPLHLACYSNALSTIEVITKKGNFDTGARNKYGLTPYGMCISDDARAIMRRYGAESCSGRLVLEAEEAQAAAEEGQAASPPTAGAAADCANSDQSGSPGPGSGLPVGGRAAQEAQARTHAYKAEEGHGASMDSDHDEQQSVATRLRQLVSRKKHVAEDFPEVDDEAQPASSGPSALGGRQFNNEFLRELSHGFADFESNPYTLMRDSSPPPGAPDRSSASSRSSSATRLSSSSRPISTVPSSAVPAGRAKRPSQGLEGHRPHAGAAAVPPPPMPHPHPPPSKPGTEPRPQVGSVRAHPAGPKPPDAAVGARGPLRKSESSKGKTAQPLKPWGSSAAAAPKRGTEEAGPSSSSSVAASRASLDMQPKPGPGGSRGLQASVSTRERTSWHGGDGREMRRSSSSNTRTTGGPSKWEGKVRTDAETFFIKQQPSRADLALAAGTDVGPHSGNANRKFLQKYNLNKLNLFAP